MISSTCIQIFPCRSFTFIFTCSLISFLPVITPPPPAQAFLKPSVCILWNKGLFSASPMEKDTPVMRRLGPPRGFGLSGGWQFAACTSCACAACTLVSCMFHKGSERKAAEEVDKRGSCAVLDTYVCAWRMRWRPSGAKSTRSSEEPPLRTVRPRHCRSGSASSQLWRFCWLLS